MTGLKHPSMMHKVSRGDRRLRVRCLIRGKDPGKWVARTVGRRAPTTKGTAKPPRRLNEGYPRETEGLREGRAKRLTGLSTQGARGFTR